MKILGYIIPKELRENNFIKSLAKQADEKGELTFNQIAALQDIIGVELDFYDWDFELKEDCPGYTNRSIYERLLEKMKRDNFRKTGTRNACVRGLNSFVEGTLKWRYIDKALGLNYSYNRRY